MKKLLNCLIVSAAFALPAAARAQATTPPQDSVHRAMTRTARREAREDAREKAGKSELHPEIRGAIRSLERARVELTHASHDFGGHRADAVKAVDEALKQLRLALTYDKK